MTDTKENYIARLKSGINQTNDLSQTPTWIERNTSHPEDNQRRWSFKGHEYQREILSDVSKIIDIQKCSQVGASEMSIRQALALLGMQRNLTLIYVLPTAAFARAFTKGRIDPVIEASKYLKSAVNRDVDSTDMKQILTSFLYVKGTIGKSANISVPAQALIKDEVDFCDQAALKLFNSRLGHAGDREIQRAFSTPTVENYGINEGFKAGSQAYYCVKCRCCREWVAPDFMIDVEIPGFDGMVANFEKEDLEVLGDKIHSAFIRCPSCKAPIHWADMCNPEKRKYIHKYPDRERKSYQVFPYDVPTVNTLGKTLSQLADYGSKKDWVNFKVGLPFEDAQTSFLDSVIAANKIGYQLMIPEMPEDIERPVDKVCSETFIGVDVGKTSWLVALKELPGAPGKLCVVYRERIRQDGNDYLFKRVKFIEKVIGGRTGVMDAGPDFSTSKKYAESGTLGSNLACYYVKKGKDTLDIITIDEDDGIVKAARTETFNDLSAAVNTGKIVFSDGPDFELMRAHLKAIKRVDSAEDGEYSSKWVSTGDDHYGHALNYAYIAYVVSRMLIAPSVSTIPVLPMVGGVRMKMGGSAQARSFLDLLEKK